MNIDDISESIRPKVFDDFVWQDHIKKILDTALISSVTSWKPLWHILFSGKSWFWKTTLATIAASRCDATIKIITWYAISRPSELVSLLHLLQPGDVLFIDEIHRLKPSVEEVLYTAMEDYCVDMLMPDGHHIRLPVDPFTLIWATTKLESLSEPLKNRFVYQFHMEPYSYEQKKLIIKRYLDLHSVQYSQQILHTIADHIAAVPRQIANFCYQLNDYLIVHTPWARILDDRIRGEFRKRTSLEKWGITPTHRRYLEILESSNYAAVGLKTLSVKLWMSEKSIESDIEPLLFELDKIEKTTRGRILR